MTYMQTLVILSATQHSQYSSHMHGIQSTDGNRLTTTWKHG